MSGAPAAAILPARNRTLDGMFINKPEVFDLSRTVVASRKIYLDSRLIILRGK